MDIMHASKILRLTFIIQPKLNRAPGAIVNRCNSKALRTVQCCDQNNDINYQAELIYVMDIAILFLQHRPFGLQFTTFLFHIVSHTL